MGADVEGAVLTIVTCARAPKAFSKNRSRAVRDRDIEETCWSRNDRTIVSELHDKGMVNIHSIFVKAIFRVNGGEGGRSVGWSWGGQPCK